MSAADWTDARVSKLKVLWMQGLTCSMIAMQLNAMEGGRLTRNAIIGKVTRLGLPGRATAYRPARVVRPRQPRPVPVLAARVPSAPRIVRDERPSLRKPPAPSATSIRFLDLKPGQCKMFCEGQEGPDGLCCGAPANGSWCSNCARTVFNPQAWGAKTRRMA